jgi:hypothetical protein
VLTRQARRSPGRQATLSSPTPSVASPTPSQPLATTASPSASSSPFYLVSNTGRVVDVPVLLNLTAPDVILVPKGVVLSVLNKGCCGD